MITIGIIILLSDIKRLKLSKATLYMHAYVIYSMDKDEDDDDDNDDDINNWFMMINK